MNNKEIIAYLINYNKSQQDINSLRVVIDSAINALMPASHEFEIGTKFRRSTGKFNRDEVIIDFNTTRNENGEIISSEYICESINHAGQKLINTAQHSTLQRATILKT